MVIFGVVCVCVQLHMLGDGSVRGATLEACVAKIKLTTGDTTIFLFQLSIHLHTTFTGSTTQLVGMSATLSNISEVAAFMTAEIYSSDFRPVSSLQSCKTAKWWCSGLQVELVEYVKLGRQLYHVNSDIDGSVNFLPARPVPSSPPCVSQLDPDLLCSLVLEVLPDNSCLVFCPTKKNCQNVALLLAKCICRQVCMPPFYYQKFLWQSRFGSIMMLRMLEHPILTKK